MDVRCTRHTLTMQDQAFRLRQLVVERRRGKFPWPSIFRVGVWGVQVGVGATTVAKALHASLRLRGLKAQYVGSRIGNTRVREAMESDGFLPPSEGPDLNTEAIRAEHGLLGHNARELLADDGLFTREVDLSQVATTPTFKEEGGLSSICWIVTDCESGEGEAPNTDWSFFEAVVLVTTAEPLAVMTAYKWLKHFRDHGVPQRSIVVVNRTRDLTVGTEMGHRLQVACERFMAVSPPIAVLPEVSSLRETTVRLRSSENGGNHHQVGDSAVAEHAEGWQSEKTWWKAINGLTECLYRLVLPGNPFAVGLAHRTGQDEGRDLANYTEENVYTGSVEDFGGGKQPKDQENL